MKSFLVLVMMFVCFLGCSKSNDTFLQQISGVWRADISGAMFTINYDNKKLLFAEGDVVIPVTLGAVDTTNKTINLNVNLKTGKPGIWTIKQVSDKDDKTAFHLVFTLHDGKQENLSFVRNISTDDITKFTTNNDSVDKPSTSTENDSQNKIKETVSSSEPDSTNTRFGPLEIKNIGETEKGLFYSSKLLFKSETGSLSVFHIFQIGNNDVALICDSYGGNGTIDQYFFVTLSQNSSPIVSSEFNAQESAIDPVQNKSQIIVDLGYESGVHRILTYQDGKISIKKTVKQGKQEPAKEEDCDFLYKNIYVPYAKQRECQGPPEDISGNFTARSYNYLADDPRLNMKVFQAITKESCRKGTVFEYSKFKKKVCGGK